MSASIFSSPPSLTAAVSVALTTTPFSVESHSVLVATSTDLFIAD